MPLTGELEHLPIVDVIQLIHSTRKSGTLNVYSRKGEGQLVFNSGYIVGASHSNEQLRIGQILCECKIITPDDLDKALKVQESAGDKRKPLIATLLDHCGLSKEAAFKSLETLIELTIVEMISWTKGFFSLEIDKIHIFDEYRYLPTQLQELNLDTQMVLLDALRIFDEKVHAGEIQIVDEPLDEIPDLQPKEETAEEFHDEGTVLSEDILGLADLDKIERKKPHVFKSLEAFDPSEIHRQIINKSLPELTDSETSQLTNFLSEAVKPAFYEEGNTTVTTSQAIIMYSGDEFLQHAVLTVCKNDGLMVFVTAEAKELDDLINRTRSKGLEPILVFGVPDDTSDGFSKDTLTTTRARKMELYPEISFVQLTAPTDLPFTLQSYSDGARAVLPKPNMSDRRETFCEDMISFLNTFRTYIHSCYNAERREHFARLRNSLTGLRLLNKAPEISLLILQFVSESFERSMTLIVDKNELVAERSVGMQAEKDQGVAAAQKFRFPIAEDSIFQHVIRDGELFYGPIKDSALEEHLFPKIGAPLESTILIVPLQSNNRTITLTYADFGNNHSKHIPIDFIEFFVAQAGIAMENALFRRQLGKSSSPQEQH